MSVSKLTELSLSQARDGLRRKDFTSVELTQEHIAAMEAGRKLNAVILETPEKALDMAKTSDTKLSTGEGGALEGLPIGVKDLFCTKGIRTTA
ncbi:MAG: amidase family protein, partial [Pseudomonadota bacterium]|nr:amidase family protein [Pseudomonadota bacterium]